MDDEKLTAEQAARLIEDRIQAFGLGALPTVSVSTQPDGTWRIAWQGRVHRVPPLTRAEWESWLERHVGPVDPERLATTEG